MSEISQGLMAVGVRADEAGLALWDYGTLIESDQREVLAQREVYILNSQAALSGAITTLGKEWARNTHQDQAEAEVLLAFVTECTVLGSEIGRMREALGLFTGSLLPLEKMETLSPLKGALSSLGTIGAGLIGLASGLKELSEDVDKSRRLDWAATRRTAYLTNRMKVISVECVVFRDHAAICKAITSRMGAGKSVPVSFEPRAK